MGIDFQIFFASLKVPVKGKTMREQKGQAKKPGLISPRTNSHYLLFKVKSAGNIEPKIYIAICPITGCLAKITWSDHTFRITKD